MSPTGREHRVSARGKFLLAGDEKLYVYGVTYGPFAPDENGVPYPSGAALERDLATMAEAGVNALRTYTVPPRPLLDAAASHGLYVMVGLPWEQHVAFLDERRRARSIVERVRAGASACAGHPALLCYAVGNEIPSPIVRGHGAGRVERFLERLAAAVRDADPGALVTYVNYPSTEYLDLSFLDLVSFNVFLESRADFEGYLARLQTLAGERPLLLTEIGLDSRRNGEDAQSGLVAGQLRASFAAGCAGAFVFSWSDAWHRGGHDVEDWDFGLTRRDRTPKPALAAVSRVFENVPFPAGARRPRVSVVVCSYNGARTLPDCLEGLLALDYPDYEVIVVDDGSTDATPAIAEEYDVRVIRTENRGLACARNTGLEAATGEIVAFLDDDARPDEHWLAYLAETFAAGAYAGVGGPNLPPADDGAVADCVAAAPGGPTHVLLSDREAEHIPGCNMAFRREALEEAGGFDPQFRIAGDDVDICWQLQDRGLKLGFSPAAVVWHRRRRSLRAYWRQQREYGRAEALLERKWPERYNVAGHVSWAGRLYAKGGGGLLRLRRRRIHYGIWGTALFQREEERPQLLLASFARMPEWYLLVGALAALGSVGALWRPLLVSFPLALFAALLALGLALAGAATASLPARGGRLSRLSRRLVVTVLHLVQPLARLKGRLGHGLTPWRRRGPVGFAVPLPRAPVVWSEAWRPPDAQLRSLSARLKSEGAVVLHGGPRDRWDLDVRSGPFGRIRLGLTVEEHGSGRQLARFRLRPRISRLAVGLVGVAGPLAVWAAVDEAYPATILLGGIAVLVAATAAKDCSQSLAATLRTIGTVETETEPEAGGRAAVDATLLRRARSGPDRARAAARGKR